MNEGARIEPPPDLPSLLLHNRIIYVGMPLVPAVSELIIAELLYLNYEDKNKPISMYINSPGTVNASVVYGVVVQRSRLEGAIAWKREATGLCACKP